MLTLAHFRTDFSRRVGLALVAMALLLQVLALPLANRHSLAKSIWESGAQIIEICSAHGLTSLKVGADGQPAPSTATACEHCIFCLVAAMGWLPVSLAKPGALWLHATALPSVSVPVLAAAFAYLWPPAHAPPAR